MKTDFYFWSTIGGEETQFVVGVSTTPTKGMLPCIVMTGVHKGDEVLRRAIPILQLYEQQIEKEEL